MNISRKTILLLENYFTFLDFYHRNVDSFIVSVIYKTMAILSQLHLDFHLLHRSMYSGCLHCRIGTFQRISGQKSIYSSL